LHRRAAELASGAGAPALLGVLIVVSESRFDMRMIFQKVLAKKQLWTHEFQHRRNSAGMKKRMEQRHRWHIVAPLLSAFPKSAGYQSLLKTLVRRNYAPLRNGSTLHITATIGCMRIRLVSENEPVRFKDVKYD
jgi:hypothetical protein